LRLYWPEEVVLQHKWKLPAVVPVEENY